MLGLVHRLPVMPCSSSGNGAMGYDWEWQKPLALPMMQWRSVMPVMCQDRAWITAND